MQVDVNRLKGKIVEAGLSGAKMAKILGINESTYYRKLGSRGVAFSLEQVFLIADTLSLSAEEAHEIFFAQ